MRNELDISLEKRFVAEKSREEGRTEGRAEGLAEGEARMKAAAVRMKEKGFSAEEIAQITGLSLEDILAL